MEPYQRVTVECSLNNIFTKAEEKLIIEAFVAVLEEHRKQDHVLASIVNDGHSIYWLQMLLRRSTVLAFRDAQRALVGIACVSLFEWEMGPGSVLQEHLVLSLDDSAGFGRIAVEYLESYAKKWDCVAIISGNALSLNQQLTENLYTRKGSFCFSHKTFVKVI
jgi:hypothetical protein